MPSSASVVHIFFTDSTDVSSYISMNACRRCISCRHVRQFIRAWFCIKKNAFRALNVSDSGKIWKCKWKCVQIKWARNKWSRGVTRTPPGGADSSQTWNFCVLAFGVSGENMNTFTTHLKWHEWCKGKTGEGIRAHTYRSTTPIGFIVYNPFCLSDTWASQEGF